MEKSVMIISAFGTKKLRAYNSRIENAINEAGFNHTYMPQGELPQILNFTNMNFYKRIIDELEHGDIMVFSLDKATKDCFFEIGAAYKCGKPIVGIRSKESLKKEYFGKMIEGLWEMLEHKTNSIDGLKRILEKIK
jgi:nucleoside 2-deoxyribosyltransferase